MNTNIIDEKIDPRERVYNAAIKVFEIKPEELFSKTRLRRIVEPRHAVFYYRIKVMGHRPVDIQYETGFDHSAQIYACKNVKLLLETDRVFKRKYKCTYIMV